MNRSEFDELYMELQPELWRFAYRLCGDGDVAHDVVQGVFTSLWLKQDDLKTSEMRPYLFGAVRNSILYANRQSSTAQRLSSSYSAHVDQNNASSPLDDAERSGEREAIKNAIDELPERQRTALILYWESGMNAAEIARVLEISHTAASNLLAKAFERLKVVLEPFRGGGGGV